jgi:hypothetical protein
VDLIHRWFRWAGAVLDFPKFRQGGVFCFLLYQWEGGEDVGEFLFGQALKMGDQGEKNGIEPPKIKKYQG